MLEATNRTGFLTGWGRRSDSARVIARLGWNAGALVGEIVCEVEKTVRFYRNAAWTANPPADTVMNLEKGV